MKKIHIFISFFIAFSMFIACSGDDGLLTRSLTPYKGAAQQQTTTEVLPATKVFIQGQHMQGSDTRSMATTRYSWDGLSFPSVNTEEGWEAARFSIRIDGTIPGWLNESSAKYWGGYQGPNLGKVATGYTYDRYDDRGFDYYKKDTKTGENVGLFRYVYDEAGIATQDAIIQAPDVATFLAYWRDKENGETPNKLALQAAIDGLNNNELKVLWYVVKEVGAQYSWHVNGILTTNDVENVLDVTDPEVTDSIHQEVEEGNLVDTDPLASIPNNVEVDIHLQEHQDWNEIKVSTHIRTDAGSVTINLPLHYDNIVEQDDFAVRYYDYYLTEYELTPLVTHDEHGVTISINNINPDLIKYLKENYGDGLTVEVHSYAKQLDNVWNELKNSTVTTGNACTLKGQITTAYSDDKVVIGE